MHHVCIQEDIAAFKDYTAEDAKGGGAPKKPAAKTEAKKEGKQETAPQQQPQQSEQKPAPSQPKQPSGWCACSDS